jgi:hypothetical protein
LQQTNTADMLDLAVDYAKDLQKQIKVMHAHTLIIQYRSFQPRFDG